MKAEEPVYKTGNQSKSQSGYSSKKSINANSSIQQFQSLADSSPQVREIAQLQKQANPHTSPQNVVQKKENNTGLPNNLKSGIESLSGYSMDDVTVHYNSSKPAQLNAHAYAQGSDIHLASGQEKHLPHEAWHVVQQKQGRVKPTYQMKDKVNINDDEGLEKEADIMGAKALNTEALTQTLQLSMPNNNQIYQCVVINSDIEFNADSELNVQGGSNPENKSASLNTLYENNAIVDPALTNNYHNGHMVAAMFGGPNQGNNIRVWSDNYEDIHTECERKVRYGDALAAPQANEKGTVTVTTVDQGGLFEALANDLYDEVENQLTSPLYWNNRSVPANPKANMINRLKGANVHKAVNAIPASVRFQYNETTGGGRTIDSETNAGLGNPAASNNSQNILNALGNLINNLVPNGTAVPHPKSPFGKLLNDIRA